MTCIDPTIAFYEVYYIFCYFDKTNDGEVSSKEFENVFKSWDFSETNDKANTIITDLKEIIKNNNLNLL